MKNHVNVWGFWFEPGTGHIYDQDGGQQPFTFQNVSIFDQYSGRVYPANPLQFATRETAEKVLAHLQALTPALELKLHESVWAGGPYLRPAVEYGVETPSGTVMNAGLVANSIMRSGAFADAIFKAELARFAVRREQE